VTEIGEKEKMKNKILASVIVATLFLAIFATIPFAAIPMAPKANAVTLYHLSMYTDPSAVPVSPGAGDYTPGTLVQLNFTDPAIVGSIRYVFTGWDIDNTWFGATNPLQYVTMDSDHNVTAHYNTFYKFTVNYPWNALWMESFTPYIWQEGLGFVAGTGANGTYEAWIPKYEKVQAGVTSPEAFAPFGAPWIRGRYLEEVIIFANWTNLGYYLSGSYAWSNAGMINMTGPMTATMAMKMDYWLWVNSNQAPTPGGQGWYDQGAIAGPLVANPIVINWAAHYVLDYWAVDGVPQGAGVNNINITMNTNHTASAVYKRQSFIKLDDNLGNFSGIKDTGKWYDDGVVYTFTAPTPLPVGPGVRYDFRFWEKVGDAWTNTSNPLHVIFDTTWDGYTLKGRWQTQYHLEVNTNPTGITGFLYSDSSVTGWYDAWAAVTFNALPIVPRDATSQWIFVKWQNQLGAWSSSNNLTGPMDQPYTMTAYYKLQYLVKWKASPTSITVTGFPGQAWVDNGTWIAYGAPGWDVSTQYVFYYWTIDAFTYNQGNTTIPLFVTGPVDGTAYYANKTKLSMTPDSHPETSPAYSHRFNVSIAASNFDADRIVGGQPMDIYAFELWIAWDPALLEVTNVYLNLDAFFAPNAYFIAENVLSAGSFKIAATVKGNYTGFSGTKTMFTLEFHVIKDACYPQTLASWISFSYYALSNHLGNNIGPELGNWCYYQVTAPQPTLEIRNAIDYTNVVTVQKNVPTSYFDVEVYLHDGVKVHDFYVQVTYNTAQLKAESVVINNYLKAPYVVYYWDTSVSGNVYVQVVQDNSVALQNGSGVLFTIHFKVVGTKIWTTDSPGPLTSFITINYAYLSVMCPTLAYQYTSGPNTNLGVLANCQYNYNPLPGDLNFDGVVNVLDLQLIADNYHTPTYDIIHNGDTDLYDLVFVALRFGNHV
jgi:hypothetical protein